EETGVAIEIPMGVSNNVQAEIMPVTIENTSTQVIEEIRSVGNMPTLGGSIIGNIIQINFTGLEGMISNTFFKPQLQGNYDGIYKFNTPLKLSVRVPIIPGKKLLPYFWNKNTKKWDNTGINVLPDSSITSASIQASQNMEMLCFTTEYLSYFAIIAHNIDSQPPQVTITNLSDGDVVGTTPTIIASISDTASAINTQNMVLLIDEQTTVNIPSSAYNPADVTGNNEGNFSYTLQSALTSGMHNLKLIVSDQYANTASASVTVRVETAFRISNIFNMPNPMKYDSVRTQFTYELSAAADDVTIEVFNTNGELMARIDAPGAQGFNKIFWDGHVMTSSSTGLANDVYLYMITAKTADGKEARGRGKLAVLR
ncbi:MAG: hypothetical protein ABIH39_08785, partial [Candidatus Margulisiibacteriota bacterium]